MFGKGSCPLYVGQNDHSVPYFEALSRTNYQVPMDFSGELIKDLLLPTPLRTWRRRTGDQLKIWATMTKADLEAISGPRVVGHARWRKDWVKVSSELARDRRAWSASVRDVVNAIGDAGSISQGRMPTQVHASTCNLTTIARGRWSPVTN